MDRNQHAEIGKVVIVLVDHSTGVVERLEEDIVVAENLEGIGCR